MCHGSCLNFGAKHLTKSLCLGKRIIEVGSLNINGSLRPSVIPFGPSKYLGVDIAHGRGVDSLCHCEDLVAHFLQDSFDIVIATELIEHIRNWKAAISNIKVVCKPLGHILITTRSPGFAYHPYPDDFWRYSVLDFEFIFNDFTIIDLRPDPQTPGVFLFAQKPLNFIENTLEPFSVSKVKPLPQITT